MDDERPGHNILQFDEKLLTNSIIFIMSHKKYSIIHTDISLKTV